MQIPITDTVDIYRLTRTGNKDSYASSPVATGLDCSIVPATTEIIALYGGNQSLSMFEIYFTETVEIRNGDKLVSGSHEYVIRDAPMVVENRLLSYTRTVGVRVL